MSKEQAFDWLESRWGKTVWAHRNPDGGTYLYDGPISHPHTELIAAGESLLEAVADAMVKGK